MILRSAEVSSGELESATKQPPLTLVEGGQQSGQMEEVISFFKRAVIARKNNSPLPVNFVAKYIACHFIDDNENSPTLIQAVAGSFDVEALSRRSHHLACEYMGIVYDPFLADTPVAIEDYTTKIMPDAAAFTRIRNLDRILTPY